MSRRLHQVTAAAMFVLGVGNVTGRVALAIRFSY